MDDWTLLAHFFVAGEPLPVPRPRARAMRIGGKWTARVYPDTKANVWKEQVATVSLAHMPAAPLDCPVRVDLEFRMPRPQRLMRKCDPEGVMLCDKKPDRDNLDKAVLDAMTNAGWWIDDGRVAGGNLWKVYHAKAEGPGVWIKVSVPDDALGAGLFDGQAAMDPAA